MGNIPKAHTCFNRLELPKYPDYKSLKVSLDYIAKNDIVGFGLDEWISIIPYFNLIKCVINLYNPQILSI